MDVLHYKAMAFIHGRMADFTVNYLKICKTLMANNFKRYLCKKLIFNKSLYLQSHYKPILLLWKIQVLQKLGFLCIHSRVNKSFGEFDEVM